MKKNIVLFLVFSFCFFLSYGQESVLQLTQPLNKKVACKYNIDVEFYWDGGCKDGLAHGFGKIVAKNDTTNFYYIHLKNGLADGYELMYTLTPSGRYKNKRDAFYIKDHLYSERTIRNTDGSVYSGEVYNGKSEGYGWSRFFDNGKTINYHGHYKKGSTDGFGSFYYPRQNKRTTGFWESVSDDEVRQKNVQNVYSYLKGYQSDAPAKKLYYTILPFVEMEELDYFENEYNVQLKINPKNDLALLGLGGVYYKRGDYQKAIELYNKALRYNEGLGWGNYVRGCALEKSGDLEKALRDFEKAIVINKGNIQFLFARARVEYKLHRIDDAFGHLDYILKVRPKFGAAYFYMALVNEKRLERHLNVGKQMDQVLSFFDADYGFYNRGDNSVVGFGELLTGVAGSKIAAKYDLGYYYESAEKYLKEAGQASLLSEVFFNAGMKYLSDKHFSTAFEYFNKVIQQGEFDPAVYAYLATTQICLKQYKQALTSAKAFEDNSIENYLSYYLLGSANFYLGDWDQAKADYEKAIAIEPQALFYNNLAVIKSKINPGEKLCQDLGKAYSGGVYYNYNYLYSHCDYRQMSETCQKCDGEKTIGTGAYQWKGDSRVEIRERCYACGGHGRFIIEHMNKSLEFVFDY